VIGEFAGGQVAADQQVVPKQGRSSSSSSVRFRRPRAAPILAAAAAFGFGVFANA
jgi:hypothetical protein